MQTSTKSAIDRSQDFESVFGKLSQLLRDLTIGWRNKAQSIPIVDMRALSAAIFNQAGEMLICTSPLDLANLSELTRNTNEKLPRLKPGQSMIGNDPYAGGRSVQTFSLIRRSNAIPEFTFVLQFPTVDFGGETLGEFFPAAEEVWAEGARVPPCLFADGLHHDKTLLELLQLNSRVPTVFNGDVLAALTVLDEADCAMEHLHFSHDPPTLSRILLDEGKHQVASAFGKLNSAEDYSAKVEVDPGCHSIPTSHVSMTSKLNASHLTFDFTASGASPKSFVNATKATCRSAVLLPLASSLDVKIWNQALLDKVTVSTAPGTVVDAQLPMAIAWGPFGIRRAVVGLVSGAIESFGGGDISTDSWVSNPIFRFATPHCDCDSCDFPSRSMLEDYSLSYVSNPFV